MKGVAAPEPARADAWIDHHRIPLRILLAPFVVAMIAGTIADWTWPSLVNDQPLLLIGLSSKNRFLLLTAPQLDALGFFVVGFLRLVFTDPVTYVLGRQYGEAALRWIEDQTSTADEGKSYIRKAERLFGRAAPLFILVAPSSMWCVLAGAARMKVWVFVTCNVAGTIGRLVLFWYAADALREPLEDLLEGIERFQVPLMVLTVGAGVVQAIHQQRKRAAITPAGMEHEILEELEELEETDEEQAGDRLRGRGGRPARP